MSRTDNTAQKFDTNFPEWLAMKLWIEYIDPEYRLSASRQKTKQQWRKEIEMGLDNE